MSRRYLGQCNEGRCFVCFFYRFRNVFSGEELGLIESQEIVENHASNSSSNDWSSPSLEHNLITMERARKSTENDALRSPEQSDDDTENQSGFALGLVKSNSVVARASMWQQLQQQAKGR